MKACASGVSVPLRANDHNTYEGDSDKNWVPEHSVIIFKKNMQCRLKSR